jgi:putative transposase
MKINRAYKTELDPNDEQTKALRNHAGAARWVYNWALDKKIKTHNELNLFVSSGELQKEIVRIKNISKENGGEPWLYEVSKCVPQCAIQNLEKAYQNFYRRIKKGIKKGFPKHKKKRDGAGSFRLADTSIWATEKYINLPKIGKIKLKRYKYLPLFDQKNIHILSATISENNYRWYVSLNVEEIIPDPIKPTGEPIGIDTGVNHLATLSDGTIFENPKAASKNKERTRLLQKAVSRKKKGSNNQKKAQRKLTKHHNHIKNIRNDASNKATTEVIAKQPEFIVVEGSNIVGMMQNHKLAGAIADAAMGEFIRKIEYKAKWAGIPVYKADRFFPSSKACSHCGTINESLTLEDRIFKCECGFEIDRDLNAAINLREYSAAGLAVTACRAMESLTRKSKTLVKILFRQEPNT